MMHLSRASRRCGFWLFLLMCIFLMLKIFSIGSSVPMVGRPATDTNEDFHWSQRLHDSENEHLWAKPDSRSYSQCINETGTSEPGTATNGYLLVSANGGLNQMRAGICDMVVIAKLMNATLVIPSLDKTTFWKDSSEFKDIFNVTHFINTLKSDVNIVEELPPSHRKIVPFHKAPVSWSKATFYTENMAELLKEYKVVHFTHADSRLANNDLPLHTQKLRCRANYKALDLVKPIQDLADTIVEKMRANGPFIALHLRYEKDMLAFTGCTHGLNPSETQELTTMRYNVKHWKEKEIDAELRRTEGGCPLTPRETALFIKALGFSSTTGIYIVAGDSYGHGSIDALKAHFPNIQTHSTLAPEATTSLKPFQHRLAAIDYAVALASDVFIYTHEGSLAKAAQGHRRFEGYRKTIIPEKKSLITLIDSYDSGELSWEEFSKRVQEGHKNRDGGPSPRVPGKFPKQEEYFYSNPFPGCICNKTQNVEN